MKDTKQLIVDEFLESVHDERATSFLFSSEFKWLRDELSTMIFNIENTFIKHDMTQTICLPLEHIRQFKYKGPGEQIYRSPGIEMFVVALLLTQPNIKITVLTDSLITSAGINSVCKQYVRSFLGGVECVIKSTVEQICIRGVDELDVRELRVFPSNIDNFRRIESSCVISDGRVFIDPKVFIKKNEIKQMETMLTNKLKRVSVK